MAKLAGMTDTDANTNATHSEQVTIYHNPACGNSRGTLALLEEHRVPHDVVRYLDTELTRSDYESFVDKTPGAPTELIRRDKRFKELGISEGEVQTRAQVVKMLGKHPELMQRPILVQGDRAIISRPPETAVEFLNL